MYKRTELKNGLRVVARQMDSIKSFSLGVWINIGGRYETKKEKGISHFLEHLLFKGSKKFSCRSIKESIEGVGGVLNGFTSEELTCYLVKMPAKHLRLAVDVLTDMVLEPALKAPDIEKEKTVILEELKMYRDLPQSYVNELLDELLWPGQPLGEPIIGTVDSVRAVDRSSLSSFKRKHYTANNMVVSAVGALDYDLLLKEITRKFSSSVLSGVNTFLEAKQDQRKPQLKIFCKDTEQTHMALGFHGFKRNHPLKHAQTLLHIILGANMSSRLFNEVREKRGLAYEIGTAVKRYQDTGAFIVHAGIDNQKVNACLDLVLHELSRAKRNLVSIDEFSRAKEFYAGQLMLALEDTMEHMLWVGETVCCRDKVHSLEEIIAQLNKVTLADLREVAKQIFNEERINLALIGPLKNQESEIRSRLTIR